MARLDDDTLITPALLHRFKAEATLDGNNGEYYALIERSNGEFLSHHPGAPPLIAEQIMWAADVLRRLNRELHHDGAWCVVFSDPKPPEPGEFAISIGHREYGRYALLWLDQDGDVQFAVEWVRNESGLFDWTEVLLAGMISVLDKCEAAWSVWNTHMRQVLDPTEGQTFKRARGERASSTRH